MPSTQEERKSKRLAKLEAEAAKPLNPIVWILFGGVLLLITGAMLLDPSGATSTQTRGAEGVQAIFAIVYRILGKPLAIGLFGLVGLLSLVAGTLGWLKSRRV